MKAFDGFFDELVARVADGVAERLRAGESKMIGQAASPLGSRRHCGAVKRRMAQGKPGAAIVGRRHLLSAEALADELQSAGGRRGAPLSATKSSVRAELLAELESISGGSADG